MLFDGHKFYYSQLMTSVRLFVNWHGVKSTFHVTTSNRKVLRSHLLACCFCTLHIMYQVLLYFILLQQYFVCQREDVMF